MAVIHNSNQINLKTVLGLTRSAACLQLKKTLNNTCSLNANFEHVCNHSSPKTVAISLSKKGTVVKNMV